MIAPATILFLARSLALGGETSVQIFPPGKHVVTPSREDGGEPQEMELVVDVTTAEALEQARASYQAAADAGTGDAPFFDFNHDDHEASAWPKRIYWAGDDPLTGGVRAEVEWSAAGRSAVDGKTFRRFSPAFYADGQRITGAPVNMGGLVNRAAFRRIAPLFAKQSEAQKIEPQNQNENQMTPEEITKLQEENAMLKERLNTLQASMDEMKKKDAEAVVAQAAKDGRIPTDPALQARWVASLCADANAKLLLLAMAPNPALVKSITQHDTQHEPAASPAVLMAKYHALPRAEQSAFYAKHAAALKLARDSSIQ